MTGTGNNQILAEAKVSALIRKFALPAIMANLVGSLYNIADQIFVGQKLGTMGNAATNVAFPLVLLMVTFAVMFGSGGASLFSLCQGEGEEKQAGSVIGNSLLGLAVSGILLFAVTELFLHPFMVLFGARGETLELAAAYTRIMAVGMPFQIFSTGASMFIRADGSPKFAMAATTTGAVMNIILDPIFIFTLDMGIQGAALATILGQMVSASIALSYFRHLRTIRLERAYFRPSWQELKRICILGLPAGLMQVAVMLVQIVMNNTLGFYGERSAYGRDIPLAVSGVVSKVNAIFSAAIMGIAQSCQPVFGYNYGAKNYHRVKETFRLTAMIVTAVAAAAFGVFQLFPGPILELFQKGNDLYLEFGTGYLRVFMGAMFVNGISILVSNFFPSIGMAKEGILASLSRQVIFQLPLILLFPLLWGIDGVLYAGPIADCLAALLCWLLVRRALRGMGE